MIALKLLLLVVVCSQTIGDKRSSTNDKKTCPELSNELDELRKTVALLSKQVMRQQSFVEESARMSGNSGIRVVRATRKGLKNYESASHLSPGAFAIHDHSNYERTLGLGEFSARMNGLEYRTRHNDFKLVMPSTTSKEYMAVEDIPFPDVPPEVLSKTTVQDQILEMREWFRAFKEQDTSIRDYTKYFKPTLCYIEGSWTTKKNLIEPFQSDRHLLDAKSWDDLHMKNRFVSLTGVKNRLENIAFLPTTIMSVNMTTGVSEYAQWIYRIICSPINFDVPLSYFQQEDDLSYRVDSGQTLGETGKTRAARYKLWDSSSTPENQILDKIMNSIPGMDNFGANLSFTVFGEPMYEATNPEDKIALNSGYYHRAYKTDLNGAGGMTYAAFGFNDDNLWVALTSQPDVAPFETDKCWQIINDKGKLATRCSPSELRVSYAMPLEIVYLTPLAKWNPYNITFHNDLTTAVKDGRNGNKGSLALNGIDKIHFYMTPTDFFKGNVDKSDRADTVRNFVYVLAPDGEAKKCSASGVKIIQQEIEGVGKVRNRYVIATVADEYSSQWKEINALKDKVLGSADGPPTSITFEMSLTTQEPIGEHTHRFRINYEQFVMLVSGEEIRVFTEEAQEHAHQLMVSYVFETKTFVYTDCDGELFCKDGHAPLISLETHNSYTETR
uniref:Uncharacterized protein n=1 Tax=Arion vulgaris TaxID=1028688 RepID=A0A0B6ZK72_9EUPU